MQQSELCQIFYQVLGRSDFVLNPDTKLAELPGWSSLTHVQVILAVEKKIGTRFQPSEVVSLKNFGDLMSKLREKTETNASAAEK